MAQIDWWLEEMADQKLVSEGRKTTSCALIRLRSCDSLQNVKMCSTWSIADSSLHKHNKTQSNRLMDKKSCAAEILDIMEAYSKHAKLTVSQEQTN